MWPDLCNKTQLGHSLTIQTTLATDHKQTTICMGDTMSEQLIDVEGIIIALVI